MNISSGDLVPQLSHQRPTQQLQQQLQQQIYPQPPSATYGKLQNYLVYSSPALNIPNYPNNPNPGASGW